MRIVGKDLVISRGENTGVWGDVTPPTHKIAQFAGQLVFFAGQFFFQTSVSFTYN